MMRGTIVTSDAQPTREGNPGEAIWQLDIPGYGVTIVESCGLFEYDGDVYHIFVAHPGHQVYLTVIQEVLNATPPEWIGIRLNDKELVGAIIDVYLIQIGAIEGREPNNGEEEPDADIDTSVC